jgi:hypothetical protein
MQEFNHLADALQSGGGANSKHAASTLAARFRNAGVVA